MNSNSLSAFLLGITTCASVAVADDDFDPQPVIEGRQAALRDIGAAFKGVNDELKKSQPALVLIRQYAVQIDDLAQHRDRWFPPGTGPESDVETLAKPEIWKQPKEFNAALGAMSDQAAKLVKVANGGDVAAIKAQSQALGKTCKSCHDKFREEED